MLRIFGYYLRMHTAVELKLGATHKELINMHLRTNFDWNTIKIDGIMIDFSL